jgi:hypothetical protein
VSSETNLQGRKINERSEARCFFSPSFNDIVKEPCRELNIVKEASPFWKE